MSGIATHWTNKRPHYIAFVITCIIFMSIVSVFGSPFLFDRGNSGRYLIVSYKTIDPQLFQSDPVVTSLERFQSSFYDFLGWLGRTVGMLPERMEALIYFFYILSRVLLIIAFYYVATILEQGKWLFVLLAGWACHQKVVPVGGMSIYMPILTHNDVAYVIILFALYHILTERFLLAWTLISLTVFIHSLVTLHFVACILPPLLLRHRKDLLKWRNAIHSNSVKSFLIGISIFIICTLLYLTFMSPPRLTPSGMSVFLSVKGGMAHVSVFNQSPYYLVMMIGLLMATTFSHLVLTRGNDKCRLLHQAMWAGTILASSVSALAVTSRSAQLSLFQPMRIFVWVVSFSYILLSVAVIEAFKLNQIGGIIISAMLIFIALSTPWAIVCLFIGAFYYAVKLFFAAFVNDQLLDKLTVLCLTIMAAGIFSGWLLGARQPFTSLATPVTIIPTLIGLFAIYFLPRIRHRQHLWSNIAVITLLLYGLGAASVYNYDYYGSPRVDPEWNNVRRWCQANTSKFDRFITPPEDDNFRSLAMRTSASERTSALVWVDPDQYLENDRIADRAAIGYANNKTDLNYLFKLASEWHCSYIIAKGGLQPPANVVYQIGKYSVVKVPSHN